MKYKKIMLVALLLAVLTLGAVSAADDADVLAADDAGDEAIADAPADDDGAISIESEDEIIGNDQDEKYNVTMDVSKPEKAYLNEEIYIWVDITPEDDECEIDPSGEIALYLNDELIDRSYSMDSGFSYQIEEFGVYNFKIEYEGDEYFNCAVEEFTYNVTNDMYYIGVEQYVRYGRGTFDVYAPVLDYDKIEITISGKKFYAYECMCDASALNYGLNTVKIYYPGDEKFGEYSRDADITVSSNIEFSDSSIYLGDDIEVRLVLPSNATGILEAYIWAFNGEDWTYVKIGSDNLKDGIANITLADLPVGCNYLYANYSGSYDDIYSDVSAYVMPIIKIPKATLAGNDDYVLVETSEGATGHVDVLYADYDDEYGEYALLASENIIASQVKVPLSGLKQGHYKIQVDYFYGEYDSFDEYSDIYVLDKYDVVLNITDCPDVVLVGESNEVYYTLPDYAEGIVTLYIDGNAIKNYSADTDYILFDTAGLSTGEHTLTLNFTSETQGTASDSTKFNVVPAEIYVPDEMNINGGYASANSIAIRVNNNASGTITILVDNKTYLIKDVDVAVTDDYYYIYGLEDISRGKHNVVVSYRDNKYGENIVNKTVDLGYDIWFDAKQIYGEDNIITIHLPKNLGNGDLTVTVDASKYSYDRNSSIITVNPSKLSIGNHTVIAKYAGDDFFPADEFNNTFEVLPEIQAYDYNVLVGSDVGIYLILPGDAKGKLNVTVSIEGWDEFDDWYMKQYDTQLVSFDKNGKAYYSFANLPVGYFYVESFYTGDDYKVEPISTGYDVMSINWGDSELELCKNKTIKFVANDLEPGQLRIVLSRIVDGDLEWDDPVNIAETIYVNITDGKATHTFTNLKCGVYHIFVAEEFMNGTLKGYQGGHYFYVNAPDIEAESGTFELGKLPEMTVNFPDDASGKATVSVYANYTKINEELYKAVSYDVNGKLTVNLNDIIAEIGNYGVHVNYTGNYGEFESYYGYKVIKNKILPAKVEVDKTSLDLMIGESTTVVATTTPGGLNVTYTSSNESVVTVSNGNVVAVGAGNATITVSIGDDVVYAKNSTTVNVTVKTIKTKIDASAVTTVYNSGKYLFATLKDANGKPISDVKVYITLNGKTYTRTTDKNGQVKLCTNGLAPVKTYQATFTFKGNSKYDKSTKTVNVKVSKANPKISAKAKTFKRTDKTKKYTITLYNNQNQVMKNSRVTLKVNGKTYSARTNSKGVATFKLTKLTKKGKFTAVVTYSSSKYYNSKTVKPQITVK